MALAPRYEALLEDFMKALEEHTSKVVQEGNYERWSRLNTEWVQCPDCFMLYYL